MPPNASFSPIPHCPVLETGHRQLLGFIGVLGGQSFIEIDPVTRGVPGKEQAIFEVVGVRKNGIRLWTVPHIFLDTEIRDPGVKMQGGPHGHG